MDVAGPLADRLGEDGVDQADDRRLAGHILERSDLDLFGSRLLRFFRFGLGLDFHGFQYAAHTRLHPVKAADQLVDFPLGADDRFHLAIGR